MVFINSSTSINIRPETSVYATYQRLSYKPWYALAEFVDNSTQNFYDYQGELKKAFEMESRSTKMRVEINYDPQEKRLEILDNAHGMEIEELTRAVVLDKPPLNRNGRCEFGMGLKTAACWFGRTWTITTSRLGSGRELTVKVHVPDLISSHLDLLPVLERKVETNSHYTKIIIEGLYKPIKGRTSGRILDHLGSMYRQDIRSQLIEILWNGTPISFEEPPILKEKCQGDIETIWKKEINEKIVIDGEKSELLIYGWIGIRLPGSQRDAGFALFRRGRLILGGPGEGYKPLEVFGQGNTFRSQRLIGEIHLDEWPVTQAKDAFDWSGGLEDSLIEVLRSTCKVYGDKCEGIRERKKPITHVDMSLASEITQKVLADDRFGEAVEAEIALPEPKRSVDQIKSDVAKLEKVSDGPIIYRLKVGDEDWVYRLYWQDSLSDAHWMSVDYPSDTLTNIYLNMAHPFFTPYIHTEGSLELLQKFVISLALAERMARKINGDDLVSPDDFRNFMNKVLKYAGDLEVEHGA